MGRRCGLRGGSRSKELFAEPEKRFPVIGEAARGLLVTFCRATRSGDTIGSMPACRPFAPFLELRSVVGQNGGLTPMYQIGAARSARLALKIVF